MRSSFSRQRGFGRARAEHDQNFLADITHETHDIDAERARDRTEHDQNENHERYVERADQFEQRNDRLDTERADRERDRTERADRRRFHDDVHDAEERMRDLIDHFRQRRAAFPECGERGAEQHRDQQNLQNIAGRERTGDRVRNQVHEEVDRAHVVRRRGERAELFRIDGRRVQVEARARFENMPRDQTDHER
jgi:hypothetical protein